MHRFVAAAILAGVLAWPGFFRGSRAQAAPAPSSYSNVEKSIAAIRQAWAKPDAPADPNAPGWNVFFTAILDDLKATAEGETFKLTQESQRSLMTRGFYILRDGRLLSNQGDVIVQNEDGIVYTLRFGEVSFATGDALSAGAEEESKSADGEAAKSEAAQESRYLFVTAEFDPKLIPEPKPTPPPANPTIPASPRLGAP